MSLDASSHGRSVPSELLDLPPVPPRRLIIATGSEDPLIEDRPHRREVLLLGRQRVD